MMSLEAFGTKSRCRCHLSLCVALLPLHIVAYIAFGPRVSAMQYIPLAGVLKAQHSCSGHIRHLSSSLATMLLNARDSAESLSVAVAAALDKDTTIKIDTFLTTIVVYDTSEYFASVKFSEA